MPLCGGRACVSAESQSLVGRDSSLPENRPPRRRVVQSLKSVLLVAAVLVFFDGFVASQGNFSVLIALGIVCLSLPLTLRQKCSGVRRERRRNLGIYLVAVVLVLACNSANNWLARRRASEVVSAVKAFHSKDQRYPQSLDN